MKFDRFGENFMSREKIFRKFSRYFYSDIDKFYVKIN